jgi:TetR/AcrR family transcriptional regulator, transcriptional repressor of aconitase
VARLSREESQKQTRARLLDSAQEIFARNGFAGASVDQIAEHAGYSKGAVYSNFESKEALFLELLKDHMSQELKELRALLDHSGSAQEILSALKERYSSMEKQVALAMLSSEFQLQAGRHPEFAEPFAALYRDQRTAIAELVNLVAQKAGVPTPVNSMEIATSLMGLTHGIALQRAADPGSVPAATAGRAIEIFLSAILGQADQTELSRAWPPSPRNNLNRRPS